MASGMCPCWADVVQKKLLEQICPDELKRFTDALLEADISEWEFHLSWRSGENVRLEQINEEDAESRKNVPHRALQALINAFQTKTGGLELDICFHDPENGDRYDEVSGLFFTISGAYQYAPAGERFKQFIEETAGWNTVKPNWDLVGDRLWISLRKSQSDLSARHLKKTLRGNLSVLNRNLSPAINATARIWPAIPWGIYRNMSISRMTWYHHRLKDKA